MVSPLCRQPCPDVTLTTPVSFRPQAADGGRRVRAAVDNSIAGGNAHVMMVSSSLVSSRPRALGWGLLLFLWILARPALAQEADVDGSKDHPVFSRMPGLAVITAMTWIMKGLLFTWRASFLDRAGHARHIVFDKERIGHRHWQ